MTLPMRTLGTSGLQITTLGFGSWAVGGGGWSFGWGPQDDQRSAAAIRRAVELGVNWIDTAAVYGLGHSEEVVGRAVRSLPAADRPLIFTKCGLDWDDEQPMRAPRRIATALTVRRGCEDSLRRLGLDHIDLFQIHWPDESGAAIEDAWAEMARLRREGTVRAIGVSNFHRPLLDRCEAVAHVDSLQPPFSLLDRMTGGDDLRWCREHSAGVLCYSPMHTGLLTDTFSAARVAAMADDDWRRRGSDYREPALSRNLALRDGLRPIAQRHGLTVAAVAVAWVLAWPGVSGAIVGARSPEQVDGWIGAASVQLTDDDLDEVAALIATTKAGKGPADSRRAG